MREVSKEEVISNNIFYSRCCLICGLYLKKNKATLNEISSITGDSISSENLRILIKFLENNGFLIVDRTRKPFYYTIKGSELGWFIRSGKQFKINAEYPIKSSMGIKPYYYG